VSTRDVGILVILVLVIVIAILVVVSARRRRSSGCSMISSTEYDRTVQAMGGEKKSTNRAGGTAEAC